MVAGAVLPIAWQNGQWFLLFGRGDSDGKWSDFGGRCDDYNLLEPHRRRGFRVLETAARECMEETAGFLGDALTILRDLVAYGVEFTARGPMARKLQRRQHEVVAAMDTTTTTFDDDEPDADAAMAAADDQSLLTPRECHVRSVYDKCRPTAATDRRRSAARQVGMKPIWRPAFDAGADPLVEWDMVFNAKGYNVFLYPMEYDARLPCAFGANRALVMSSLLPAAAAALFEKCELRWFTISEARAARADFRPFYQEILDAIIARLLRA